MEESDKQKIIREELARQMKNVLKLMTSTKLDESREAIYSIIFNNAMITKLLND